MFDPTVIKRDFPILARQVHGQPLVYLDSAATSQKPVQVLHAITDYYENHNANVHRGVHQLGDESTTAFHQSRRRIAEFFHTHPSQLIITRNETEAANHIAYTWGATQVQAGDILLGTEMDHHSNIVPWQELAQRQGAVFQMVSVTADGYLDLEDAERKLAQPNVKLFAFSHVSNTLGTLNPVAELVALARRAHPDVALFVDGAQAAPHIPVHFDQLDVDFYALSAHKMLGPMGIGGLLMRSKWVKQLPPFLFGGGMIDEVTATTSTFTEDPEERFTAGTPDVAGLVGWAAACEYLQQLGMTAVAEHDRQLVVRALELLAKFPQVTVIGPRTAADRVGSVAFVYQGVHAHDVGQILDAAGVAVRSGHHCTMPLHVKFGWPASTRLSFQVYTTLADLDVFVRGLHQVHQVFGV